MGSKQRIPGLAIAVLAGGGSARMGRDKAWLDFRGEPLLTRLCRRIAPAGSRLLVAAGDERALPALPADVQVVPDRTPGEGPLAGLAAISAALPPDTDSVFVCTCDAPFLDEHTVRALARELGTHAGVVPTVDGRAQPLAGLYRRAVIEGVARAFAAGERRGHSLCEQEGVCLREAASLGLSGDRFLNVNRPEDHERALALDLD